MAKAALMDFDKALELFEPVLGFEVHVELNTETKMFSPAGNPANERNHGAAPNTLVCRCVSAASLPSDDTATASVGPSAAPSANAAASGIAGHMVCSAKPTATMVAIARPIANDSDSFTDLSSSDLSISCASKYSSGAMNSTMNSSGLSVTSGKNGSCDANAPSAICTRGVETLGMKRLMKEDNTTAAMIHRINSNTANMPPSRVFPTFFKGTKR